MRTRVLIVVLAAVALGGCGGEASLSASSAEELKAQVAAVRTAASDGDRAAALEALDGMADQVRDLEAGGSLAKADAACRTAATWALSSSAELALREASPPQPPSATAASTTISTRVRIGPDHGSVRVLPLTVGRALREGCSSVVHRCPGRGGV